MSSCEAEILRIRLRYTGSAVESIAEIVLRVEIVDEEVPGVFRIENDHSIIHIHLGKNADSPEDAVNNCFMTLMDELVSQHDLSQWEAYVQMSINPAVTVRVYQFVHSGLFTVGVKLDKTFLGLYT